MRQARPIEEVVAFRSDSMTITGGDLPEDVSAIYWTTNANSYFGVPAILGRDLGGSDAPEGKEPQPVTVLSYKFPEKIDEGAFGKP